MKLYKRLYKLLPLFVIILILFFIYTYIENFDSTIINIYAINDNVTSSATSQPVQTSNINIENDKLKILNNIYNKNYSPNYYY